MRQREREREKKKQPQKRRKSKKRILYRGLIFYKAGISILSFFFGKITITGGMMEKRATKNQRGGGFFFNVVRSCTRWRFVVFVVAFVQS